MNAKSITFKIISLAVALTFLSQQILFAADYTYGIPIENENNNSGFMSSLELAEAQSHQEELIRIMNDNLAWRISNGYAANEELELKKKTSASTSQPQDQGQNKLSVSAESGDVLDYINSSLARVVLKDGRILEEVTLSGTGDILSGVIRNTDASIVIVGDGKIRSYIYPDGRTIHYDDLGRASSQVSTDGLVSSYSYDYDETGALLRTRVTSPDHIVEYDKDLLLQKVTKSDSTVIEYSQGIIKRKTSPDGGIFTFDIKYNPDSTITSKLTQYTAASGAIYRYNINSNNSLTSVAVEKDGVTASYNKDGALSSVSKNGQTITSDTVNGAKADYDTALAIYRQKELETQNYQTILSNASADLASKTAAKDAAQAGLDTAAQDLKNAQSAKEIKQTAYTIAYNDYVSAQSAYDSASVALNNAKTLEAQANQELINAQNTLTAKQAAYNSAVEDRQAKEVIFNTAAANLTNAKTAKTLAENALSNGSPYIVSSYTYSPASTLLNQYKNFINDQFNSYNSNLWSKPADSLVTIGSGIAALKGTGVNYNALLYTKQSYLRSDKPVLTTTFKVDSTQGKFIAALDGYTSSGSYRRIGIFVQSGRIYAQTVSGSSASTPAVLISTAKANTNYNLEFDVTSQYIKMYLWESSTAKPAASSYTYAVTDWATVRPYFSLYSGTGTIDYVTMKSPNYNSTYNSSSQLTKDVYQDGNVSTYSYSTGSITISDYKKYLDSPYSLLSAGLWYKPADTLVTINNGIATLKGTGANYNALIYSNQTFDRANDVIVRSNFQASSTSGRFIAAVDGYTSSGAYRRVGVTMQSGRIYVQTVNGSTTSVPAALIATAKANTNYTVEIQASAQNIKIYLWESSSSRPTSPSYTYTITDWSAVRPYFAVYSGTAAVSNMYINYIPQVRTVLSGSSEYSQVLARNQLVKNLNNAIINVNSAQTAYNSANTALNAAKTLEAQSNQNLLDAKTSFNIKQAAYNSAVEDRQAKEAVFNTAAANLAAKTTVKQQRYADLQSALQALKITQSAKDAALAAYNSAYAYYLSAQAAETQALTIFNNAKSEEGAAKTRADSLFDELNTLLCISSMFPSQDSLLASANNKLNIISAVYDSERRLQQIFGMDGTVQNYTKGLMNSILSGSGEALYSYDLSVMGNIEETTIDRDGIKRIYDKYGNLTKIFGDGISASVRDNQISLIEKDDGTIIEGAVFDSNNNIKSANVTRPDGVKAVYSGGVLTEARQPDGSAFYYDASGNITKFVNDKGITYIYSTIEEDGQTFTIAGAEDPEIITDPEEIVYQKYDGNKRLVQVRTKDGAILNYSYSMDGTGKIIFTFVSDGKTITTYDENNNIKKTEILPTADDPVSTISEYEYGRIRRVYKGSDLIYRYTYEFDDAGKEITAIENVTTGDFNRYKDGLLTSVTDTEGLVTSYEYNTEERIVKSVVTYLGKVVNQYTYTYEGDDTTIEDSDGVQRTYDKDNKLKRLEEGGRTYGYTYVLDDSGREISNQELIKVKDDSGAISNYSKGALKSIEKQDGVILSDFVFTSAGAIASYSVLKDSIKYFIEDGRIVKEIKADQTIIEYYADGWMKSVTSNTQERADYSYERSVDGGINYVIVGKNNIKSTYDKDGRLAQVVYEDSKAIRYLYDESQPAALKGYELIDRQSHYFYDTSNRLIKAVDSNGREYDYEYTENQVSVTSPYTSKYSSIEDIVNFNKENLEFIDSASERYLEIASYPDPNVPLLLHLEGADNAVQTTDSSYADHSVSFNGSAHLDAVNKRIGSSSLALDGSGGNLSIPDSDDWYYGAGSMTYDFWIKWAVVESAGLITQNEGIGRRHNFEYYAEGQYFQWYGYASIYDSWGWASPSFIPAVNTWYHIAAVKNKNTLMIFINGVLLGTRDITGRELPQLSAPLDIGYSSNSTGNGYFDGSIDELRITKGKALWTSNFTPPEEGYRDLYKNNGVLTSNPIELNAAEFKTISWNELTPQGTDITIQTRTGDTPNPDDLTWSGWSGELGNSAASNIASPSAKFIQYKVNFKTTDSQVSPKLLPDSNGSLVRIDYVERFENIFNAVTNGIDNNVELIKSDGADILRLASYPDPNVPLLLHLEAAGNAVQTLDSSIAPHSVTFNGNAHLDAVNKKIGTSSLSLDGSGYNLSIPDSDDWYYGAGSMTYDFWIKWASVESSGLITQNEGVGRRSNFYYYAPGHYFGWLGYTSIYNSWAWASPSFTPTANTWYHIAAVRNGNTLMVFVNGSLLGAYDATGKEFPQLSAPLEIGGNSENSYLNGWMDEVRITKGKALWTSNFTPPEAEYKGLYKTPGTIISNPIPIVATEIGGIIANVNTPAGTSVIFKTRTGASPDLNDGTWGGWVEAVKNSSGWQVHSPVNKYLQYELILNTLDVTKTPNLYSDGDSLLSLSYSYNKSFDATAPPDDLVFKNLLTLTPPAIPESFQITDLNPDRASFNTIAPEIESRVLPDAAIIQTRSFKEGSSDIAVETTKDNKITSYVNGKVQAAYQKYDDNHLELLIEYSYDADGGLLSVNMPFARNSIDTQIATARQKIAQERANYLRTLSEQRGLAYTQIRDQIQTIRDQINTQRASLPPLYQEVQRSRWVGWWIFGWYETYTETVEVPGVRDAMNQLNEQDRQLNNEEANAYAQLDSQVNAAMQKLNQDEGSALAEITNQESSFQAQIVKEESTPVILEYYRSILGRDPDEAETNAWLAQADYDSGFDATALRNALENSSEHQEQEVFVEILKSKIRDFLYDYLTTVIASPEGAKQSLASLGLTADDVVPLTQDEVDAILSFLDKQNIHFGRSAFVALHTILSSLRAAEGGEAISLEDLALKTILIDIFTGSLNKFSEGTLLELSMYSLSKAAESYGLTLYNTRLNYDDLMAIASLRAPEGGEAIPLNIIAHLKNNHYVVITNISADGKISYREHNRGQNGYTWTVSKEDFENSWTGYSIVPSLQGGTDPSLSLRGATEGSDEAISIIQNKKISDNTAMRVKGSCLPFLIPLIMGIVGAITSVATAVVGVISGIVAGISAILGPIISGIGALISGVANFMVGIGTAVFNAVSFVGSSLLSVLGPVGSWIGGIGSFLGNAFGLGGIITSTGFNLTGLGLALGKTVALTALSIGISKGLEALGVNSTISGPLTSFVTGGVGGLFNSGFSALSFITGGIQGLAIQGVNQLGTALGIDPMLTNVISMTAGSFIGAVGNNISPTTGQFNLEGFSTAIGKTILPSLAGEFSYYGITKAGELLGVDPRISYLAGVGIRSTINAGLTHDFMPDVIWGSVTQGLLQGVTNIGLNFATEELGISPLLANIGFSAISGAINAGIQAATGGNRDVFGTLFKTYTDNALTFLGSGDPSNAWQQAAYISQILDFSNIVQERGLVDALNSYGAGFFNAVAVNQIVQSGMSIGQYFASKLAAGQYTTRTLQDGTVVKEVAVTDGQNTTANAFFQQKQVGESTYWDLIGGEEYAGGDSYLTWGDFGVDAYGKLGYTDAELYSIFDSDIQYQRVIGGQQVYAEIKDSQGNMLLIIEPTAGGHYNVYNSIGEYESARVLSTITDMKLDIANGTPTNVTIGQGSGATTLNMSGQDFSSLLFSAVENGKIVMDKLIKQTTWLGLVGIAEAAENITSPLTGVANLAIDRINSGQSVDLASLASTSTWQSIFAASDSMKAWADTATLLFVNSVSPTLAPGTEMLMNIFGSETFREQLSNQALETFNGYNLLEQLASIALGNPGSGSIIEQIGVKSFWEGIKSTAELVWDNKNMIANDMQDLYNLALNPAAYLTDQFWASDIGREFISERNDFLCLTPRDTRKDYDGLSNTAFVDQDLSYADIFNQPVSGILDLLTLVRIGNVRWDSANIDAAPYYDAYVRQGVKGISISGINDDGTNLNTLTKNLVSSSPYSFTVTHSSGRGVLTRSTVVTNKTISISPQDDRRDVEAWIDRMGLSKDQVLIVDTAGDLPYRPIDLVDLSLQDILNPANITNPVNLITTDVQNLFNNNAYHDYSSNPTKYTYVRLESGPGIGINPVGNHTVGIDGALDSNGNLSMDKKYRYSVNGVMIEEELTLGEIYTRFLKGEL